MEGCSSSRLMEYSPGPRVFWLLLGLFLGEREPKGANPCLLAEGLWGR